MWGDCKDRLIRNSIVAGLSSTKAYQQCILKGSNLTLNEYIRICQTEDATCRQVQALQPESIDCTDSTPIYHMTEFPQAHPRTNFRDRGGYRGPFRGGKPGHRGSMGGAHPGETTGIVLRLHVGIVVHGPTDQERNARLWAKSATTVVDSDISQKYAGKGQTIKIVKRLQSNTLTWRNSPQTTFKVSTPPLTLSPMSKRKPQSNASRLQLEFTTFKTETQNTSDPYG